MGGGCCWYRKFELNGGGLGIGVIELWLGKPGLPRPREPKMGECWPAMEKKGLGWGGGQPPHGLGGRGPNIPHGFGWVGGLSFWLVDSPSLAVFVCLSGSWLQRWH